MRFSELVGQDRIGKIGRDGVVFTASKIGCGGSSPQVSGLVGPPAIALLHVVNGLYG